MSTMTFVGKKEPLTLFFGDITAFLLSLWLTLFFRFGEIPSSSLFQTHLLPFAILFIVWVIIFIIVGLYDKHTVILKSRLPVLIFNTQVINSVVAVLFFYFIPYFGITPKTTLFIYLIVSFVIILGWRIKGYEFFGTKRKQNAILIGSGEEMKELRDEVNNNSRYALKFVSSIDLNAISSIDFQEDVLKRIYQDDISIIAIDMEHEKVNPILPHLYNLIFSKVHFVDMHKVYEDIFDRIPLSLVQYNWFLENISLLPKIYDATKRFMDIFISLVVGIISLVFYPFVYILIKIDDFGPIFSTQVRVGQNNKPVKIFKFRTMNRDDGGKWGEGEPNKVTRIGRFLRDTRIDELPQLWNVLKGDISLIGPRPEFADAVKKYDEDVPYYNIRHLIKPGLSGWAQIHHDGAPHHGVDLDETKIKLSYDLFYLKNRSFFLDFKIALQTIRAIITRTGA